jgi:protein required for attachment to host cells
MKARTTWILVADGARARGFTRHGVGESLVAIPDGNFTHEVERVAAMGADRPGRVHESADKARHAIAPHTDWRREGKRSFAHTLAEWLERHARTGTYDRLILVAAPRTLGDLREALGAEARERLAGQLAKDLTAHPMADIEEHLRRVKLL